MSMDKETEKLVNEILRFCDATGMKPTTFGAKTMADGKFVGRLQAGGSTSLRNAAKVRAFIAANRKKKRKVKA